MFNNGKVWGERNGKGSPLIYDRNELGYYLVKKIKIKIKKQKTRTTCKRI
jgi:hypothetical protein